MLITGYSQIAADSTSVSIGQDTAAATFMHISLLVSGHTLNRYEPARLRLRQEA